MTRQTSKGKCNLCNGIFSKAAMTNHLKSCKKTGTGRTKTFHLMVEGRYLPDYWMHFEVPVDVSLKVLDSFLRRIWLECCGHMSMFAINDTTYSVAPSSEFGDKSMNVKLEKILEPGMKFYHEYDFGSTTHLALKVIYEGQGQIEGKSIHVLARNEPPPITCVSCGKTATQVCTECLWGEDEKGWLCDDCAADHKCGEDMLLPVVNSPRVGTCGYTGD